MSGSYFSKTKIDSIKQETSAMAETIPMFSLKQGTCASRTDIDRCMKLLQKPQSANAEIGNGGKIRDLPDEIYMSPSTATDNLVKENDKLTRRNSRQLKPQCHCPSNMDEPDKGRNRTDIATYEQKRQFFVDSSTETPIHDMVTKDLSRPSSEIKVGTVIASRYEILSEVSRGGYGIVYRARQIGVDRVVALKRLRSQSDITMVQRFLQETQIIKNLIHPNTIQLIDAGIDSNHIFLVMEYIEGHSLHHMLRNGRAFDPLRALNIARQILKSVNEAHQRGIIHRDLKPSNILVRNVIGERDFVKVLDFGIAKVQNGDDIKLTHEGSIMGTPQYLAPEVFLGQKLTVQSDLFSIGLILYEMLTGNRAMPPNTQETYRRMTSLDPIAIPEKYQDTIIEPFLSRALQKDPVLRYRSAEDMLRDLQTVEYRLKQEAGMILKTSCPKPFHPSSKRRNGWGRWAAFVAAILIANAIVIYWMVA